MGVPHFMEHPEDLGVTSVGQKPGSVWQFPEQKQLLERTGASTWAIYQCHYGCSSPKPTRFKNNLFLVVDQPNQGWPKFDLAGHYLGPLPAGCGHGSHDKLVGLDNGGKFKTAAAAAYPPKLCQYIADLIVDSVLTPTLKGGNHQLEAK